MSGFKYIVSYGGGEGPDVWDRDKVISAVDIADATRQAQGIAEECWAWVFSVVQDDYASTREQLEETIHNMRAENAKLSEALRDCHMLAVRRSRNKQTVEHADWMHVRRFCEEAGIVPNILREEQK